MFYRQAPGRIVNRSPFHNENATRSRAVYGPQQIIPGSESQTRWTPWGTFVPHPYMYGGHDALHGAIMSVSQADLYDKSANPFPANGVWDEPGGMQASLQLVRLEPSTSAHPGYSESTGPGPAMLFHTPPVFGLQTIPIVAVGV